MLPLIDSRQGKTTDMFLKSPSLSLSFSPPHNPSLSLWLSCSPDSDRWYVFVFIHFPMKEHITHNPNDIPLTRYMQQRFSDSGFFRVQDCYADLVRFYLNFHLKLNEEKINCCHQCQLCVSYLVLGLTLLPAILFHKYFGTAYVLLS